MIVATVSRGIGRVIAYSLKRLRRAAGQALNLSLVVILWLLKQNNGSNGNEKITVYWTAQVLILVLSLKESVQKRDK